jgi:hypothetical protein
MNKSERLEVAEMSLQNAPRVHSGALRTRLGTFHPERENESAYFLVSGEAEVQGDSSMVDMDVVLIPRSHPDQPLTLLFTTPDKMAFDAVHIQLPHEKIRPDIATIPVATLAEIGWWFSSITRRPYQQEHLWIYRIGGKDMREILRILGVVMGKMQ